MWLFFNKDYKKNNRRDVVFIENIDEASSLIDKKIAQEVNPHEAISNLEKKNENN